VTDPSDSSCTGFLCKLVYWAVPRTGTLPKRTLYPFRPFDHGRAALGLPSGIVPPVPTAGAVAPLLRSLRRGGWAQEAQTLSSGWRHCRRGADVQRARDEHRLTSQSGASGLPPGIGGQGTDFLSSGSLPAAALSQGRLWTPPRSPSFGIGVGGGGLRSPTPLEGPLSGVPPPGRCS
jgi:hypothetical protein